MEKKFLLSYNFCSSLKVFETKKDIFKGKKLNAVNASSKVKDNIILVSKMA